MRCHSVSFAERRQASGSNGRCRRSRGGRVIVVQFDKILGFRRWFFHTGPVNEAPNPIRNIGAVKPPTAMSGIVAKLQRVDHAISELREYEKQFSEIGERLYVIEKRFDKSTSRLIFEAYGHLPVDPQVPVVAGEVIHHLRSILDHLICLLAIENSGAYSRQLQFPICDTEGKFLADISNGRLRGLSEPAKALVRRYQPFHDEMPHHHALWGLHKLDITEKHRAIYVTPAVTMVDEVLFDSPRPVSIIGMRTFFDAEPSPSGAPVFWVESAGGVEFDAHLKTSLRLNIKDDVLKENTSLFYILDGLKNVTRQILYDSVDLFEENDSDSSARRGTLR